MGLIQKLFKKGLTEDDLYSNGFKLRNKTENHFYFENNYLNLILGKSDERYYFLGLEQDKEILITFE